MGPATRASGRALRSKHDANTDGGSQAQQASATSTDAMSANATSAKAALLLKAAERSLVSETVIFLLGPDRTIYRLDNISDTARLHLSPYVRDLYSEIRQVRLIRRKLQVAAFIGNELRVDIDAEAVRTAVLQLENRGQLQYATLQASNILKVLHRVMKSDIPWNEESQVKKRVHELIVQYKDTEALAFDTTMDHPSPGPSSTTLSGSPQDSAPIVVPLPETLPATFDHLLKWLDRPDSLSTDTNADGRNELANATIVELAQLYLLVVKLGVATLVNEVAASLLALQIDASTLEDLINYINSDTAPGSDLRQFLITAVARCATSEALEVAIEKDWMTKEIWAEVTLAFVHERDEVLKKWEKDASVAEEVVKKGKEIKAEKQCEPAAKSKKRGAAEDADTPKGKKRKT